MVEHISSITGTKTRLYIIHGCSKIFTTAIYFIVCNSVNSENNLSMCSRTHLIMILAAAVLANHSLRTCIYVTTHPQLKQYTCATAKTCVHQTTHVQ